MSDIKEWIAEQFYGGYCEPEDLGSLDWQDALSNADQIISYLKSQNVVRLRDYQQPPIRFLHPDDKPNTSYRKAQEDMIKANFKAVEDLE